MSHNLSYMPKESYKWLYREYRKGMKDDAALERLYNQANHEGWYRSLSIIRSVYHKSPARYTEEYKPETDCFIFVVLARK